MNRTSIEWTKHHPNHKDTNKANNASDNLEWATSAENNAHARAHGLLRGLPGETNGRAKLNKAAVVEIRRLKGVLGQRIIAKRFRVSRSAVQFIHQGKHWMTEWPEDLRVREYPG